MGPFPCPDEKFFTRVLALATVGILAIVAAVIGVGWWVCSHLQWAP